LERQATAAGLSPDRFRLLGLIDNVAQLHHTFDVYVQSSDLEGTSNAVLEAMALETPIVATDVGGTSEVARHGQEALIIPKGDENALVSAVLDVVNKPDEARVRVDAARTRVETELSFDLRTRRLEAIYDEVASRAGLRARPTSVHA
jgi:glycosyltransferase involved in cell wall biosynthesis